MPLILWRCSQISAASMIRARASRRVTANKGAALPAFEAELHLAIQITIACCQVVTFITPRAENGLAPNVLPARRRYDGGCSGGSTAVQRAGGSISCGSTSRSSGRTRSGSERCASSASRAAHGGNTHGVNTGSAAAGLSSGGGGSSGSGTTPERTPPLPPSPATNYAEVSSAVARSAQGRAAQSARDALRLCQRPLCDVWTERRLICNSTPSRHEEPESIVSVERSGKHCSCSSARARRRWRLQQAAHQEQALVVADQLPVLHSNEHARVVHLLV
jgi:hypothetical protein